MEKKSKKPLFGVLTFSIGTLALATSTTYFIIKNNEKPAIRDAEYLVSVGEWIMQPNNAEDDSSNVVWIFNEIGKGLLTTNNHIDDHEFKWSIEDGKLKIETDWLYSLYDEFDYELDQEEQKLEIKKDEQIKTFKPAAQ